ncbi:hypothetical protein GCM10027446_30650 [Angustibacter peucedani]
MLALGIICLIIAAALVIGVLVTGTSQEIVFDSTVGNFTTQPVWVFLSGAAAMLLVLLGLSFFGRGTRRRVARRKEMKRLRRVEEEHVSGPVPTTRTDPAAGTVPARDGYDEPDRELVREPRTGTAAPTTETYRTGEPTDLTAHERPATTTTDDARHREV